MRHTHRHEAIRYRGTSVKLFFSKHWQDEQAHGPEERRHAPRHEMNVVCTTAFEVGDTERRALLLDISRTGARFGTALNARDIGVSAGQVLHFYVSTPYGAGTWVGKVVWTRPDSRITVWGVEFTERPGDKPLSELLGEPVVAS